MLNRINFRDFGGGLTRDGKRIRTGLLFRSGVLQKLNENDKQIIESLNIQSVIDFRSLEEQERDPAFLPGKTKISMPCNIDRMTRERLRPLLLKRHADEKIIGVIDGVYSEMVDLMAESMGKLVSLILTPGATPLIIHCRAGKDRTGFAAAMIQWFLGMDRADILSDYLKSNDFLMPRISKLLKRLRLFTIGLFPKGNLQAAFEVKEKYLLTAMEKVDRKYGGIEKYLMSSGITATQLEALRTLLLESA
jgi:protein-tyrosine phosphatase